MSQEPRKLNIVTSEHQLPYLRVGDAQLATSEEAPTSFGYNFGYGAAYEKMMEEREVSTTLTCPCASTF